METGIYLTEMLFEASDSLSLILITQKRGGGQSHGNIIWKSKLDLETTGNAWVHDQHCS